MKKTGGEADHSHEFPAVSHDRQRREVTVSWLGRQGFLSHPPAVSRLTFGLLICPMAGNYFGCAVEPPLISDQK
jgi:hypothetical protein